MPLPELVELVPLDRPLRAEVTIPGSKSITNRALVMAALSRGAVTLERALWSEDTQVMIECLGRLGFEVQVERDEGEISNRRITVIGRGGELPRAGTPEAPLELFVGNAGTAARFLTALVCLGRGSYRLHGVPRMHERPQSALFDSLRQLGYRIDSPDGRLPAVVHGSGPRPGRAQVSVAESSQYASALLLAGRVGGWTVDIVGANPDELPYVEMTAAMVRAFPDAGGVFAVEPDASSGSYFHAAAWLLQQFPATRGSDLTVKGWPRSGWQIDAAFPDHLPLPPAISRERDLGDSIMTAVVLAPFAAGPTRFTDLGRLRVQECERVVALRTELTRCGARVTEVGDTLQVQPGPLHGAEIETYSDHRVAMCFATLGLVVPGIVLRDPACVRKTFPNFFAKLAAPPPGGLGMTVLDGNRTPIDVRDLVVD
jgi:3-phosphoshikimate 1-carboxyvinyltransferase